MLLFFLEGVTIRERANARASKQERACTSAFQSKLDCYDNAHTDLFDGDTTRSGGLLVHHTRATRTTRVEDLVADDAQLTKNLHRMPDLN